MLLRPRVVFVAVAAIAATLLGLLQHPPTPRLSSTEATRAVMRVPADARMLAGVHAFDVAVTPIDSRLTRVTFAAGGRWVAEFALDSQERVVDSSDFATRRVPYGNWLAYEPGLLAALALVFVLCTAVAPWRRTRNLDVLGALSLAVPLVLLQRRYVTASVLSAAPGLVYLLARCAWVALAPDRVTAPAT